MTPESPQSFRYWLKDVGAIGLILLVVGWQLQALFINPNLSMTDDYDGSFIAWSITTIQNKMIGTDERGWFDGGIFYPEKKTLAYSDYYLLPALMTLPVRLTTNEPVVVLNTAILLAQALTAIMLYFWLHEICHDRALALAGTIVYSLAPGRMIYLGSLATFWLWGVPLSLLALTQLRLKPSKSWLGVWFLGFWVQLTTNFLSAWFVLFASGLIMGLNQELRRNLKLLQRPLTIALMISGFAGMVLICPYLWVARTYHYTRPITDVIHFSMSPEELITLYFSPVIMMLLGLGLTVRRKILSYHWLMLASTIMALGPTLHWMKQTIKFPLPYLVFYFLAPGFNGFRTPSRWMALATIASVVAGVMGLRTVKPNWRLGIALGLMVLAIKMAPPIRTVAAPTVAQIPEVYGWLQFQPPGAVIELPMFRWGSQDPNKNEVYRMIYQTKHGMPLVNGYSGFSTPEWEDLVARLHNDFPSAALLEELRGRGVKYLIIHQDEFEQRYSRTIEWEMEPIYNQNRTEVYEL